jgi:hypothetical protein
MGKIREIREIREMREMREIGKIENWGDSGNYNQVTP